MTSNVVINVAYRADLIDAPESFLIGSLIVVETLLQNMADSGPSALNLGTAAGFILENLHVNGYVTRTLFSCRCW